MSDKDLKDEADVIMTVSRDSKKITLEFKSEVPFTVESFVMELETYLHEISVAGEQSGKPGVRKH